MSVSFKLKIAGSFLEPLFLLITSFINFQDLLILLLKLVVNQLLTSC